MQFLEQWRSYFAEEVPPGAHPMQVRETQKAFYAGAAALLACQGHIAEALPAPAAQDDANLALYEELAAFIARFENVRSTFSERLPGPHGRHHCLRCGVKWDGPQESVDEHVCQFDEEEPAPDEPPRIILLR